MLRFAGILFLFLMGILFSLPGIADLIFRNSYYDSNKRPLAAQTAARLDPFNGLYRYESSDIRNLLIAIELEPRNVWYRRKLAQLFWIDWEKTKSDQSLRVALEQYQEILKLAPNVPQFQNEFQMVLLHKEKFEKQKKLGIDK